MATRKVSSSPGGQKQKSKIPWEIVVPLIPLLLWLALLLVFPHVRLLALSFMRRGQKALAEGGIFFGNYLKPFQDPDRLFIKVFSRTILFSVINTLLTLAVAYPIAFYVAKVLTGARKFILLILIIEYLCLFVKLDKVYFRKSNESLLPLAFATPSSFSVLLKCP